MRRGWKRSNLSECRCLDFCGDFEVPFVLVLVVVLVVRVGLCGGLDGCGLRRWVGCKGLGPWFFLLVCCG